MIIDRIFTPGLAQVAYLIADEATGDVAVIDPRRDVQVYVDWAAERRFQISAIFETHVHADFVSGALELHRATGAPMYSSALGNQAFPYTPLRDGDQVAAGSLLLEARWTPGHTPEHIVFLLFDPASSTEPQAMFSGDLIFAGEIGRPDLLGSAHTTRLAKQLFETLQHRIEDLPDDLVIYPGHTAGSSCGRKIGNAVATTLGAERRHTYAWQFTNEDDFIRAILDEMPSPPPYYPRMKTVNRADPAFLASLSDGAALTAGQVATATGDGALVIDARDERSFDRAHLPNSYFAGSGPDFVAWVGWRAPYDASVILLLDQDSDFEHFSTELHRIGIDEIAGFLAGGIDAWMEAGQPTDSLDALSPERFQRLLQERPDATLLDVRSREEWKQGHIEHARNQFAGSISSGLQAPVESVDLVLLTCASGHRSRVAASILQSQGNARLVQLDGGMDAWDAAGLPVERN